MQPLEFRLNLGGKKSLLLKGQHSISLNPSGLKCVYAYLLLLPNLSFFSQTGFSASRRLPPGAAEHLCGGREDSAMEPHHRARQTAPGPGSCGPHRAKLL